MIALSILDYAILSLYLIAITAVGLWIARKVKDFTSFFLAGRAMTVPILISTLVSTYYGLDVTFGVSEVSFAEGVVSWFVYSRPYYLAIFVAAFLLIRQLRAHPFLSLPDIADHLYGRGTRIVIALACLFYNLPILAIMGMGVLFQAIFGIPEIYGYLLGASVAAAYTLLGGLWADAITDTLQFVLMCVTLAFALPLALDLVGGFDGMVAALDAKYFLAAGELPAAYLLALTLTALSVFVEPAFYQRIFAAKDERSVRKALLAGIFIWAAYDWAVTILGIAAAAAVKEGLLPSALEGREALIQIVLISLPVGLKGFFIAGVLSAAMSTVDSYLLLSGGNLVYDIYRPLFAPDLSEPALLKLTRIGIVLALLPCLIIVTYFSRITDAWIFMSNALTATAFVPLMAGLFLPRARKPREGIFSSVFGFGILLLYYGIVGFLGLPQEDSYILSVTIFSETVTLWREYGLFFALPASALGFLLGTFTSSSRLAEEGK